MSIDASTLQILGIFQMPALFAGAFFFGETVILSAFFLAGRGLWSPVSVFWLSLAGTVAADTVWFLLGRRIALLFDRWEKYAEQNKRLFAALERMTGRRPYLALLFVKFLYGTRVLLIMYLSMRRIGFRTFILFDTMGTILWLAILMAIGWLAGSSIVNFVPVLNRVEFLVPLLIFVIIMIRWGSLWIRNEIIKQ